MKYYFKTKYNIFEATVNDTPYGAFIKIGGKTYKDCINISVVKAGGTASYAKIPHLESEPECGYSTFLNKTGKDSTVDFIRGSIQFVNHLYPTVTRFEFMDDSKIECGKRQNTATPPRKMVRPLSLAHLYLANYGETWYENKFGARLMNEKKYKEYRDAVEVLSKAKSMTYEKFKVINSITDSEQNRILEPHFESSSTWAEFFKSIPKDKQCAAFGLWLPFFINSLLKDTFTPNTWYIDLNTMTRTNFSILDNAPPSLSSHSGGTRRAKRGRQITFSNNLGYGEGPEV